MIDGIGKSGAGRYEPSRGPVDAAAAAAKSAAGPDRGAAPAAGAAVADLVSAGPPVEADKIAAIRAAIAEGRYPVDPDKIAERMIALDLPHLS